MQLVDSHAHIYLPEFAADWADMLKRAQNEGVNRVFMPAIDTETHGQLLALADEYPQLCYPMMGVHPCSVKGNFREELDTAKSFLGQRHFWAIGETGLDFYWDKTFTEQQYLAFHEQMEWALEMNLPVVIHSRQSTDECIQSVTKYQNGNLRGVFHCFSGNEEQAKQITGLGFFLGIGGVLTFKNSGLDKAIKNIDPSFFVLETDSPYLAPVPFRGKTNEPSYLKYVVQKLADVKEMNVSEMGSITTLNAQRLFKL
jgi:TatD DNase family protein